jgi:hypothetical protein
MVKSSNRIITSLWAESGISVYAAEAIVQSSRVARRWLPF